jgi:hypothetical protein
MHLRESSDGCELATYDEDVSEPRCQPKGVVIRALAISIEVGHTLDRFDDPCSRGRTSSCYRAGRAGIVNAGSRPRSCELVACVGRPTQPSLLQAREPVLLTISGL